MDWARITIPLVLMSRLIAAKLTPKLQRTRTNKRARANSMPKKSIQLEHKRFTTKASPSLHKLSLICKRSYKTRADRAVQRSPNQCIAHGRPLLSASFSRCDREMTTLAFVKPTTTQYRLYHNTITSTITIYPGRYAAPAILAQSIIIKWCKKPLLCVCLRACTDHLAIFLK